MMASARFLIAGTSMYFVMRMFGAERPTMRHWLECAVIGSLLLVVGNGGVVLAEKSVPTGIVSLLVAMVPVYIALVEAIKAGFPGPKKLFGLLLGTAGIFVLVGPGAVNGTSNINWFGIAAVSAASLAWAAGSVYSRTAKLPKSMVLATAMQMICGGFFMGVISLALGEWNHFNPASVSNHSLLAVSYLIIFGSIIAYSAYVWLLKSVSPSAVATYAYVNPIVAVFLGWACAGEKLSMQLFYAAAIIIAAVYMLTSAKQSKPAPMKPVPTGETTNALTTEPVACSNVR
jgi:drug/metabolite transporter (DMT)-like permease